MEIKIDRTKELYKCYCHGTVSCVDQVLEKYDIKHINVLDFENFNEIEWEGIETGRLFVDKVGTVYRFNHWIGEYPFIGVEIEKIGIIIK